MQFVKLLKEVLFVIHLFIRLYFSPPVNPPKEIVDPNDKKPKDWDEREK